MLIVLPMPVSVKYCTRKEKKIPSMGTHTSASAYLYSPRRQSVRASRVPARIFQVPACWSCCSNCRGILGKPSLEKGGSFSRGPIMDETEPLGETFGEMVDRIIGEVAREWVAQRTGLKE